VPANLQRQTTVLSLCARHLAGAVLYLLDGAGFARRLTFA